MIKELGVLVAAAAVTYGIAHTAVKHRHGDRPASVSIASNGSTEKRAALERATRALNDLQAPPAVTATGVPMTEIVSGLQQKMLADPDPKVRRSADRVRYRVGEILADVVYPCLGPPTDHPFTVEVATNLKTLDDDNYQLSPLRVVRVVGTPYAGFQACAEERFPQVHTKMMKARYALERLGSVDGEEHFLFNSPEAGACSNSGVAAAKASAGEPGTERSDSKTQ